jgi:hypothetical protein
MTFSRERLMRALTYEICRTLSVSGSRFFKPWTHIQGTEQPGKSRRWVRRTEPYSPGSQKNAKKDLCTNWWLLKNGVIGLRIWTWHSRSTHQKLDIMQLLQLWEQGGKGSMATRYVMIIYIDCYIWQIVLTFDLCRRKRFLWAILLFWWGWSQKLRCICVHHTGWQR